MKKIPYVHIALILVSVFYGANYSLAKFVMPAYVQPTAFILVRVAGCLLLFALLWLFFVREKIQKADYGRVLLSGLTGTAINQLMFFNGLNLTTPINASLLQTTTPILLFIASAAFLQERINMLRIIGLGLAGMGAVTLIGGEGFYWGSNTMLGNSMVLLNALSFSFFLIVVKPLLQKYNTVTLLMWIFLVGFVVCLPFGLQKVICTDWQHIPASIWAIIAFVVLGPTFLAYLFNIWSMRYVSPSIVGAYMYLQPFIAALIAVFVYNEALTYTKLVAGCMILSGVFLVTKRKVSDGNK